ncbi:MAG: glycosyltransferase family 4 protein [Thermoplasmata archaeon]
MRIVLPVLRYLPALGGATRHVQLLAEGFAARGHSVTVVTQSEPDTSAEETIAGVRVVRLGMRHVAGFRVPKGYLHLLRSMDADVLQQTGNRIWNVDYYLPFARSFEWPQVIMPLGFYHYWMRKGVVRWLYYDQYLPGRLRAFDRYVALTKGERDQVIRWKYPAERIRVIPVGIDLAEFARPSRSRESVRKSWGLPTSRVAVYVGGMYDNKRVDRLIRAVAATKGAWGLIIIGVDIPGTSYDRAHCEHLTHELSAPVRFLGAVPRPDVVDALFAADAYVQGSEFEGFGISLLEAMAVGRPFVAFDTGAARELSGTGAGICVRSEGEMTAALASLPERAEELGKAGRLAAQNYSVDRMVERHLELYESIRTPETGIPRGPTAPCD